MWFFFNSYSGDSSVVCAGVAGRDFPQNRYPGRLQNSVGYHSRDGRMYYNDKYVANMMGKRYSKGTSTLYMDVKMILQIYCIILFLFYQHVKKTQIQRKGTF